MEYLTRYEESNRRTGMTLSVVFHALIIALMIFFGRFHFQDPPPEQSGVLVNLGIPDVGQGEENAPAAEASEPEEEPEPVEEEVPPPAKEEPKKEPVKEQPKKEVVKTEDPEAAALKKRKEEEKKKADAEAKAKAEEARKQREAEEAAKKKAAAEKAAQDAKKKELEDLVKAGTGGGKGGGKGNTGKPGNQGDPNGGNSDILEGKSTGSGVVGGGLGNRGVLKKGAAIQDNSQEEGTIYLDVCVDKNGAVVSAEFTQKGSTSNSSRLKQLAIQNAKQWKFQKGDVDKQCGTIRYDFKLK